MALREKVVAFVAIALLALAAHPGPGGAAAPGPGAPTLEAAALRLAVPATQEAAIVALQEMGDPAVEPLLRALKDGALYLLQGRVAVLGDDGALKDLRGQPILDPQGQPVSPAEGQEVVALEERYFGLVQRALQRLEIFGADRDARKAAAFKFRTPDLA